MFAMFLIWVLTASSVLHQKRQSLSNFFMRKGDSLKENNQISGLLFVDRWSIIPLWKNAVSDFLFFFFLSYCILNIRTSHGFVTWGREEQSQFR